MVRRVLFGVLLACTIAIAIWWPRPDALPTAPEAANSPVATAPAALAPATTDGKDGAASTAAARDPERTQADGRFAFSFWPPSPSRSGCPSARAPSRPAARSR